MDDSPSAPFEGPEKLLEIWFAPSATELPEKAAIPLEGSNLTGLRKVPREVWEQMLAIVQCKILSFVQGDEMDAFLLSESSLFVSPNRLILKTCGTTLNLYGLPRILEISRDIAGFPHVHQLFYSRKAFMFPERQLGPHRDWRDEVQYLDDIFQNGSAYTVGKVNGDHWLLYMVSPGVVDIRSSTHDTALRSPVISNHATPSTSQQPVDYTIEILMSNLSSDARLPYFTPEDVGEQNALQHGQKVALSTGIASMFPPELTRLDAYAFSPCGFSSNALISWDNDGEDKLSSVRGEGYYTIHVTPEEGWSYASFECNVPLPSSTLHSQSKGLPDLQTLIHRVVDIFQPGKLSVTLFISSEENARAEDEGESEIEMAQRVFKAALTKPRQADSTATAQGDTNLYRRTDKINYEFGGYDLAFASFELRP